MGDNNMVSVGVVVDNIPPVGVVVNIVVGGMELVVALDDMLAGA